jgi:hypothetical protein
MVKRLPRTGLLLLAGTLLLAEGVQPGSASSTCRAGSQRLARVELFFGAPPSERAWRRFVDVVVTPRFPDGLTVLHGDGQWRSAGRLTREAARVVVIVYKKCPARDAAIEAIRTAYKMRFRQKSVLRVDTEACAAF